MLNMAEQKNVIIIGGGIWGFSTAWHLAKGGVSGICVVEQNAEAACETTRQAAGLVGQLRSSKTMCEAIQYALDLFEGFQKETGHDPGLRRVGSLLVAMTPQRMVAYEQQVARANENGVEASFVSHSEMQRLAPAMDVSQLEGGYFIPGDGYLNPRQCALAYAGAARDLGVEVRYSTRGTGLKLRDGKVEGITTDAGDFAAENVIVTAGPWTGLIAQQAGFDLPMQTIRHQRARTEPIAGIPEHHPVVRVNDVSCYVRPEQGGYLYGFFEPAPSAIDLATESPEFRTSDLPTPIDTMAEGRRRLSKVFPILESTPIAEYSPGITTFAPDGRYLIGRVPGVDGLLAASGCAALGIAGSAAVGNWLAFSIAPGIPSKPLTEFSPQRFGRKAADREWVCEAGKDFYANYYSLTPGQKNPE
jgi:glycine/D-amino acid oxidase-like deaminating enzyme